MTRPAWLALTLCGAAVWFGARLGPQAQRQGKPLETSTEAAGIAERGFVREAVRRQPDATGEAVLSPLVKAEQSSSDPAVWEATGTGAVPMKGRGLQQIEWQTRQTWNGRTHKWRLNAVQITRPKKTSP